MSTYSIPAPAAYNTSYLHRYIDRLDQQIRELRGSASMLYRKLIEINFKYRMCPSFFITNQELMAATGFCWRTLRRARRILQMLGLIKVKPSAGRGHATVYTLRHTDAPATQEQKPQQVEPAEKTDKQAAPEGVTLDDLKNRKAPDSSTHNWPAFVRRMQEYRPQPDELGEILKLAESGRYGNPFWSAVKEIESARTTPFAIKNPIRFILSKLRK